MGMTINADLIVIILVILLFIWYFIVYAAYKIGFDAGLKMQALDTIHKYQQIEQIISDGYLQGKSSGEMILSIKGIMNGNNTN